MQATLTALRAIGVRLVRPAYIQAIIVTLVLLALPTVLVVWLTSLHGAWALLFIPLMIVGSVAIGMLVIFGLIIRFVSPPQDKQQRAAVRNFVDNLTTVADLRTTPRVFLLLRIMRDISAPRRDGYIGSMINRTAGLKQDFTILVRQFRKP